MIKTIITFLIIISAGYIFLQPSSQDYYQFSKSKIFSSLAKKKENNDEQIKLFSQSKEILKKINNKNLKIKRELEIIQEKIESREENKKITEQEIKQEITEVVEKINEPQIENKEEILEKMALIITEVEKEPEQIIKRSRELENPEDTSLFLFYIALLYLKDEKIELAIETVEKIKDKYYYQAALVIILNKISHQDILFTQLIQKIKNPAQKSFIFLYKLEKLLKENKLEPAKQLVSESNDPLLKEVGWWKIANFQIENDNVESAIQIIKKIDAPAI